MLTGRRRRRSAPARISRRSARWTPTAPGGPLGFTRAAPPPSRRSPPCPAGAWPAGSSSRCGAICGSPTRTATFGCAERRWGVPLVDGGTQRLPRIIRAPSGYRVLVMTYFVTARRASSAGTWSSGCSSARATSTCSCGGVDRTARRADAALGRRAAASGPCSATSASRCSGSTRSRSRAARHDRPLLPPRRDLRHDRRRGAQRAAQRRGHAARGRRSRTRWRPAASTTSPRSRSPASYRGVVPRGHVRRGAAARPPLPPHEVRVRADRAQRARRCRGASTGPAIVVGDSRTGEMDKIDGPYYFFKLIQSSGTRCRSGCRWSAPSWAARTSCRSTTSPPRWTTSPTSPASTARPSTSSTRKAAALGEVAQHVRARPAGAPRIAMRIDERADAGAAQGRARSLLMQLPGAQAASAAASSPTSASRTRSSSTSR